MQVIISLPRYNVNNPFFRNEEFGQLRLTKISHRRVSILPRATSLPGRDSRASTVVIVQYEVQVGVWVWQSLDFFPGERHRRFVVVPLRVPWNGLVMEKEQPTINVCSHAGTDELGAMADTSR